MNTTKQYARTRRALIDGADRAGVKMTLAIRVLVAVADRGGTATTKELYADLAVNESMVRQAIRVLYDEELAVGEGSDGGPRRNGVQSRLTLTETGRELARWVIKQAGGKLPAAMNGAAK